MSSLFAARGIAARRGARALIAALALIGCRPAPRRALAPLPVDATAAYLRGRTAFFEGDYALSVDELARAMAAAPDQAGVAIAHAQALTRAGRHDDARAAVETLVVRFPDSPEGWIVAGDVRARAGDARAAIAAYRRARRLDPSAVAAYLGLAAAYAQAGEPAAAARTYRELTERRPDVVDGHWRLARLALARGDDRDARPRLERVIALDRDHLEARRALALLQARAGDWRGATLAARANLRHSGGDPALADDLMRLLLEQGDRDGALAVLGDYLDDPSAEVRGWAAERSFVLGATALALAAAPATRAGRLIAARALAAAGRRAEAAAVATALGGDDTVAIEAAGLLDRLALEDGAPPPPVVIAARASAPTAVALIEPAAERDRRAGAIAAARDRFVVAARRNPRDPALAAAWARFELRVGEPARAQRLADKLLAAVPDDVDARNLAGYVAVEVGADLPRARRLLAAARRDAPGDPFVLDSWGWYRRAAGDLVGADRALRRALAIAPREREIALHAAVVADELGDHGRAALLRYRVLATAFDPHVTAEVGGQLARQPGAACYAAVAMRTTWLVRIALGSTLAVAACDKGPSKADCEQLLDHLIALEASSGGAAGGADKATKEQLDAIKGDIDKQKGAIRDYAVGQKFIATCTQRTPIKVVKCGLAAQNADELAQCDR